MTPLVMLGCVCFVLARVVQPGGKQFPMFTWCFLGRIAHITQCKICITIKLPPNISIALEKICVFKYYRRTACLMIEDTYCGKQDKMIQSSSFVRGRSCCWYELSIQEKGLPWLIRAGQALPRSWP